MIVSLFAVALLLLSSSNALSLDSSVHLARHQHIAARHIKRSSVSARCKARPPTSSSVAVTSPKLVPSPVNESKPTSYPPAPSPSPSPSPAPSPSPSSGKAGIAWPLANDPALKNFITPKISTIYTWNPDAPPDLFGLEFCPMLWGTEQITNFANVVKPGYATCVLSYNEPNLGSQSNLDPTVAAQIWMAKANFLRQQGYSTMIAPAITSAPDGVTWLQTFFKACIDCKFEALGAHYYGTDAGGMIDYLTNLHKIFGMPIWVTEFACQDFTGGPQANMDQVFAFMSTITKWMDETDFIVKYFAYGVMRNININPLNQLMNDDGTPNRLGRLYIGS